MKKNIRTMLSAATLVFALVWASVLHADNMNIENMIAVQENTVEHVLRLKNKESFEKFTAVTGKTPKAFDSKFDPISNMMREIDELLGFGKNNPARSHIDHAESS